jgi:hypothetical protein
MYFKGTECEVEAFAILGCYAASVGSFLPTFRERLSVLCIRQGRSCGVGRGTSDAAAPSRGDKGAANEHLNEKN